MAKLDLIPDPEILVIQGLLFGAAAVIVRNKFVKPYLALRESKDSLTTGNQSEADEIFRDADAKTAKIEDSIRAARRANTEYREKTRNEALEKQQGIVKKAEQEVKDRIEAVQSDIKKALDAEMAKLPGIVTKLGDQMYQAAIQ